MSGLLKGFSARSAQCSLDTAIKMGRQRFSASQESDRHHVKNRLPVSVRKPVETFSILSISPVPDDHVALNEIVCRPDGSECIEFRLEIDPMLTLESAFGAIRHNSYPVVLCERDLGKATWKEVLSQLATMSDPPLLVVTSRLADDYLWAEALNLGAHDVLAKPFDAREVGRVLNLACLRWRDARRRRR